MTVSIPASRIWKELRDGPYEIPSIQIFRNLPSGILSVEVPTGNATLRTAAFTRNQWNRGPLFGEEHVNVHGVGQLPSGRFLFAEVEWQVNTPGGYCSWNAGLSPDINPTSMRPWAKPLEAWGEGDLPTGRTNLSLIFDGGALGKSESPDWKLMARINCRKSGTGGPPLSFDLDSTKIVLPPKEYEPLLLWLSVMVPCCDSRPENTARVWFP